MCVRGPHITTVRAAGWRPLAYRQSSCVYPLTRDKIDFVTPFPTRHLHRLHVSPPPYVVSCSKQQLIFFTPPSPFLLQHGTCPVCRRYYCPGELHLPQERVTPPVNPTVVQRLYRTICSPLAYFFPRLVSVPAAANANNGRRPNRPTPMYRLVRSERVLSDADRERIENEALETMDDYVFCHVMFVMQNSERQRYPGTAVTVMAEHMRNRFGQLHRLPGPVDVDPAGVNPPPPQPPRPAAVRQGFEMPTDVTTTEYLGHY